MTDRPDSLTVDRHWNGRSVLVTGAGGFIGSHLVQRLVVAGARVRAFVRYNSRNDHGWLEEFDTDVKASLEVFRGDLTNPEAVSAALDGCATAFHLGALIPIPYSYRHPREFVTTNVFGTFNVLDAARRMGIDRLVHVSTSEVYGSPEVVPIRETHPLHAQSPYAATKIAADQLALSYYATFGTNVVIARPFNTFGPRQSARAVIPTIITQALQGPEIRVGTTTTRRDFVYVTDTVEGILRCGETTGLESAVLNLGTGVDVSVDDILTLVSEILDRELRVVHEAARVRPPRSEVDRLVANSERAAEVLGWRPAVSLHEGLRRTVEWLASSLDAYKFFYNV
jgi:dTDP-glucose 4,6-dehydratase